MANHGYVTFKKPVLAASISQLLWDLNIKLFRDVLEITYSEATAGDVAYGPHTWLLVYRTRNIDWVRRVCWLESSTQFTMRHGGGSRLAWWMDTAILNEVAVQFNGTISDDGIDDKWAGEPGKYNEFSDYVNLTMQHCKDPALRAEILKLEMEMVPAEWHITEKAEVENAGIADTSGAGETDRRGDGD